MSAPSGKWIFPSGVRVGRGWEGDGKALEKLVMIFGETDDLSIKSGRYWARLFQLAVFPVKMRWGGKPSGRDAGILA